ncbi:MAG: hypothetical protein J0G96_13480 [Flavobacteriia bacterium]|nr:hypothetical protein [Flavobacteriia bacterium]OJX39617.1 MAG: hypothetical protein BGO87_11810 [Flavobacteriia bacterium 40-80]
MNKLILLIGLLSLGIIVSFQNASNSSSYQINNFSSNQDDSIILWNKTRKLIWDDFKGKPPHHTATSSYDAISAMTFSSITMRSKVFKDSIIFQINNEFKLYKSWKIDTSELLLEHEQVHFDIREICARSIRRDISKYVSKSQNSTKEFVDDTYNRQIKLNNIMDDEYDKQTELGTNITKQKEWTAKIAKMLNDLEAYSSSKVVIKRVGW